MTPTAAALSQEERDAPLKTIATAYARAGHRGISANAAADEIHTLAKAVRTNAAIARAARNPNLIERAAAGTKAQTLYQGARATARRLRNDIAKIDECAATIARVVDQSHTVIPPPLSEAQANVADIRESMAHVWRAATRDVKDARAEVRRIAEAARQEQEAAAQ